jgi:hypothetical protein
MRATDLQIKARSGRPQLSSFDPRSDGVDNWGQLRQIRRVKLGVERWEVFDRLRRDESPGCFVDISRRKISPDPLRAYSVIANDLRGRHLNHIDCGHHCCVRNGVPPAGY